MTGFIIRDATVADLPDLAELMCASGHGVIELLYENLVPGQALTDILIERRLQNRDSFAHLSNWRVACDSDGTVTGAACALPYLVYASLPGDPLFTEDRLALIRDLITLEAGLAGSFCLTNIAVRPCARDHGLGQALLADIRTRARTAGFDRIGLSTFGDDPAVMGFYRRAGFHLLATAPLRPHPRIMAQGRWAILEGTCP